VLEVIRNQIIRGASAAHEQAFFRAQLGAFEVGLGRPFGIAVDFFFAPIGPEIHQRRAHHEKGEERQNESANDWPVKFGIELDVEIIFLIFLQLKKASHFARLFLFYKIQYYSKQFMLLYSSSA
jgi:hypothetical protein